MAVSSRNSFSDLARSLSRRDFIALAGGALGFSAFAAACTGNPSPAGSSGADVKTISAITSGAQPLSVISPTDPVGPGKQFFGFALATNQRQFLTGGQPQVWFAPTPAAQAIGPTAAAWLAFTGYEKTGDRSPRSPIPGIYVAEIEPSQAGTWSVAVVAAEGSTRRAGESALPVTTDPIPAPVGGKAKSTKTPVATSKSKIAEICTREPVCSMHAISLDDALSNGKPTVVSFATPLLCESQLCGPVVDEQILVFEKYGRRANFVHVEEFLPGKDRKPPQATAQNASPAFKAWGFQDEPWVIVIDGDGIIRNRLGPGPAAAPEIEAALKPLL